MKKSIKCKENPRMAKEVKIIQSNAIIKLQTEISSSNRKYNRKLERRIR